MNVNIEMFSMLNSCNYEDVEIPKDAETYMKLGCMEKFMLALKLSMQEFIGGKRAVDILNTLEKPLTKTTFILTDIDNNTIGEYGSECELMEKSGLNEKEFKYLKSYVKNDIKNPKYDVYYKYRLNTNTYVLKGNDYILQ